VDRFCQAKGVREAQLSDRLQAFFESKGIADHGRQFTLDDIRLKNQHAKGLVAVNDVDSLAATNPGS
jgi:hypothetical protein